MGKFLGAVVVILLVSFAFFGSEWLKKVEDGKSDEPRIANILLCKFVSFNAVCEQDLDVVEQESGDIYSTVEIKNITNATISVKWEYVQGGTKSIIAQNTQEVFDNGVLQFKLEKNLATGWLLGEYIVTVSMVGGNELSKEFAIVSE